MKRWLLPAALLLSLGFNFGLLASYLLDRFEPVPTFAPRQVEPAPSERVDERVAPVRDAETPPTTVASVAEVEGTSEVEATEADGDGEVAPLVLAPEPVAPTTTARREQAVQTQRPSEPVAEAQEGNGGAAQEPRAAPARPGFGAARRLGQRTDFEQMADRLELSGEQRERFLADHLEFASRVRQIAPRTLRLRRAFFGELSAAQPDEEKIKRLTQQLGAANVALERALADVVLKTRSHLDVPRQQEYLRYIQTRVQRLQEFVQRGGPRPRQGDAQRPRMRRRPNVRPPAG